MESRTNRVRVPYDVVAIGFHAIDMGIADSTATPRATHRNNRLRQAFRHLVCKHLADSLCCGSKEDGHFNGFCGKALRGGLANKAQTRSDYGKACHYQRTLFGVAEA